MNKRKFFVTGATGLVGSHTVGRLLERGTDVRVLARRPADDSWNARVEVVVGDLSERDALRKQLEGVDCVIHCAGAVGMTLPRERLWSVNVEGTERLLQASLDASVARFVHLSSVAVYGAAAPPVREDSPKRPVGAYPESKWEAEQLVFRYGELGLKSIVLRPCVVYGERDRHAVQALSRLGSLKLLPLPRGGSRRLDLVHAEDVADALLAAADKTELSGRAYNVTDGAAHTQRDIVATYARLSGRRPAIVPVPGSLFALAGLAGWGLSYLAPELGRRVGRLRALDVDLHYSIDRARQELAYRPRVGLDEGLSRTLAWFEEQDVLTFQRGSEAR